MHVDDRMSSEERVPETLASAGLTGRPECALVAIQRCEDYRSAGLQRDAGGIGELLQRNDVCVELLDDRRNAVRILASVGSHALVHVIGGDAKG
jgi:hypothetical protein